VLAFAGGERERERGGNCCDRESLMLQMSSAHREREREKTKVRQDAGACVTCAQPGCLPVTWSPARSLACSIQGDPPASPPTHSLARRWLAVAFRSLLVHDFTRKAGGEESASLTHSLALSPTSPCPESIQLPRTKEISRQMPCTHSKQPLFCAARGPPFHCSPRVPMHAFFPERRNPRNKHVPQ
jgi:hypothetical protein